MFVQRLKQLRAEKDISQSALANIMGVSQQAIAKWETDKATPDPDALSKLADYFSVSVDYLLGRTDERRPINPDTGKQATAHETRQLEQILEMNGLTFMGTPLSEDDKERIKQALELAFWDAKRKNKRQEK